MMDDIDDDYDLEVLLELRQRERDEAEQRYVEAMEDHRRLGRRIQELEHRRREMVSKRERERRSFEQKMADGGGKLAEIQSFDRYVAGLRDEEQKLVDKLEGLRRQHRRAREAMEQAHDEMVDAVRDLEAVNEHYESWRRQKETDERRRREAKMDDVAARMWRDNQSN